MAFWFKRRDKQPQRPPAFRPLRVVGRGMCCAIGHHARAATAAINARINHFRETEFIDGEGRPIVGAALYEVDAWGDERLGLMLRTVLAESLAVLGESPQTDRIALILLCPEPDRPGAKIEGPIDLFGQLCEGEFAPLGPFHSASRLCDYGKGGLARALQDISALMQASDAPEYVVLAAADTFLDAGAIEHYLSAERLATEANPDGFIPAEGAAALLLTHGGEPGSGLFIEACASAQERWRLDGDAPLSGTGLTAAMRDAAAQARTELAALDFHASGMTGESWYAKEVNLALARALERRIESFPHHIIASTAGETGCAAPLLTLGWLADVMGRDYGSPGRSGLLHFAGDDGQRAAIVVRYRLPGGTQA